MTIEGIFTLYPIVHKAWIETFVHKETRLRASFRKNNPRLVNIANKAGAQEANDNVH